MGVGHESNCVLILPCLLADQIDSPQGVIAKIAMTHKKQLIIFRTGQDVIAALHDPSSLLMIRGSIESHITEAEPKTKVIWDWSGFFSRFRPVP